MLGYYKAKQESRQIVNYLRNWLNALNFQIIDWVAIGFAVDKQGQTRIWFPSCKCATGDSPPLGFFIIFFLTYFGRFWNPYHISFIIFLSLHFFLSHFVLSYYLNLRNLYHIFYHISQKSNTNYIFLCYSEDISVTCSLLSRPERLCTTKYSHPSTFMYPFNKSWSESVILRDNRTVHTFNCPTTGVEQNDSG